MKYLLQGALLLLVLGIFRLLPIDTASTAGGWLGRRIGPRLRRLHAIAMENISQALPELDADRRAAVIADMWENLGRVLGEFPHLGRFYPQGRIDVEGAEHAMQLRDDGIGGIFFSAHFGNWELLSLVMDHHDMAPVLVYRAANNPWSERIIQHVRKAAHHRTGASEYLTKSGQGLRQMVKALRDGKHLAMLVDQKMNTGIPLPFFGRSAMTSPVLAQLALKYRVPIVPARIERLPGSRFRLRLDPPMDLSGYGDSDADVAAVMLEVNHLFETWIREHPDHWLWIHNRWPKTAAESSG